jgi:hypothetical protein
VQLSAEQQIPKSWRKLAFVHKLGSPQIMYTSPKASSLPRVPGFLALFIACSLVALFLYLYTSTDLLSSWLWWQFALAGLIIVAWLVIGSWIILTPAFSRRLSVVVCPQGLIYSKGKKHIIRWEQVVEFWKDIRIAEQATVSHSYTLRLLDGTTWMFNDSLANDAELGAIMEDEVIQRLVPVATTAYLAGKALAFGEITISQWGISVRRRQEKQRALPWGLVQRLHLDDTSLSFYKVGEFWAWMTLPVAEVPNVGVLKRMVEQALLDHDPAALSEMIAQYSVGLPVFFGDLSFSLQGIAVPHADRFIPWSEVLNVEVGESGVVITRGGKYGGRYIIPLMLISKVSLLKDFIYYLHPANS